MTSSKVGREGDEMLLRFALLRRAQPRFWAHQKAGENGVKKTTRRPGQKFKKSATSKFLLSFVKRSTTEKGDD
jgi:hypothetical protein